MTVLSSDDPVRVFQRFATVDAISHGRAEVILGRGSFTESFPLFGYDLSDYDVLFEEKLELFVQLLDEKPVTWSGTTRAPLEQRRRLPQDRVRTPDHLGRRRRLTAVGRAHRALRAAAHARHHRRRARALRPATSTSTGAPPTQFGTIAHPVGMHSPGFIADTDEEAKELYYPRYKVIRDRIGALRGWPPIRREEFDAEVEHGSLYVGSPETVARKIARAVARLGVGRFDLIYTAGLTADQRPPARRRALRHEGDPDGPRHPRRD